MSTPLRRSWKSSVRARLPSPGPNGTAAPASAESLNVTVMNCTGSTLGVGAIASNTTFATVVLGPIVMAVGFGVSAVARAFVVGESTLPDGSAITAPVPGVAASQMVASNVMPSMSGGSAGVGATAAVSR